ncbi:hypothetical protein MKX03_008383 [Papaver bracteatum]|nr:hypothetical protein MKX03_008383 [Papaver bracteatum]
MGEEIILQKSEKKKHKRIKEKEALSSSEVPKEKKKKQRKSKEIETLSTSEVPTEKKKHKKSKDKAALSSLEEKEALNSSEVSKDVGGAKKLKESGEKEGASDNGREESGKRKNKKDKEMVTECSDGKDHIDVTGEENNEHVKTGKGKNKRKNENGGDSGESYIEKSGGEAQSGSRSSKKKKKKKGTKSEANIENTNANIGDVETQNNLGSTNEHLRNSDSKNSSKRVKFASHVEVFPSSDDQDDRQENLRNKLVQGNRFTRQEDQIIKDAVHNYIEAHKFCKEGLDMILNCMKHPNIRTCWKEIGAGLPYRPYTAVYQRGHTLFERADSCKWTEDEKAFVLKFYEKHGPDWKGLGQALRRHVRDTWRRTYRVGLKTGNWDQSEYQSLFNLVNKDLRMRMYEERASKHGLIRDNISWQAISDRLATRTQMKCCTKWYDQLSSSMVKEGKWADTDDYRLLDEPGDITLKRWRQMVNHIGIHGLQSLAGQVEVLAKRYCPVLLEVREALDSRPVVD